MKKYNQLNQKERDLIDVFSRKGESCAAIGKKLKRDKSTIARELKRNSSSLYHCYLAHRANQRAKERRSQAVHRKRLRNPLVRAYVLAKLKEDWSPEQIAGRIIVDRFQKKYGNFHQQMLTSDGKAIDFYRKCGFEIAGSTAVKVTKS